MVALTREQIAAELRTIERALADRITIVRTVLAPDGTRIRTIRRTVFLPRGDNTPQRR